MAEARRAGAARAGGARRTSYREKYRESLRNVVIRVLAEGPMHGYEIMKRIEEITEGRWRPAPGALYPLLDSLLEEGLIEIERVDDKGVRGGKKKVYKLTEKGWRYLADHLRETATYKVWIVKYMLVLGARRLREHGMEAEAEEVCRRLSKALEDLMGEAGDCLSGRGS